MKKRLAYGKEGLEVRIPDGVHCQVVEPLFVKGLPDQEGAVREALRRPTGHAALQESVRADQRVAIIFSDITRATPYHILVPALLEALSHLPDEHIVFFCATGTHRDAPREELITILGEEVVRRFRIVQNNCTADEEYLELGTTPSGNRVRLNREMMECDLRILTGFIEPHFFAGFSGGGKALMPGMAHVETIRHNHAIRMLDNEKARWGFTQGNPLWEDVMAAAELAAPLFLLNITMNRDKEITGVFAGDLRQAHREGAAFAKQTAMVKLDEPFDIVLTSNSGYPLDLNVYQSVKGMSAAERIIKPGGSIVVAAECWDGVPAGSDYEGILHAVDSVEELMDYIKAREAELRDTWQVCFQAMIQMKAKVWLFSQLDAETVRKTHLNPVDNIDRLLEELVDKHGPGCRICIMPEGPHTIPYLD